MKGFLVSGLLAWIAACQAQTPAADPTASQGEFQKSANGLIYSERTMGQLRHIVDSLNLKHKVCELRRVYQSVRQGPAQYVRLEKGDLARARQALEAGSTPENFKTQFPKAEWENNLLVVSYTNEPDEDKKGPVVTYRSIPFNDRGECTIQVAGRRAQLPAPGRWVVSSEAKTSYSPAYVEAFYFPAGLTQRPLPKQYATQVQYVDCLVDTTAQIYLEAARRTGRHYRAEVPKSAAALLAYVHQQTQQPALESEKNLSETEQQARWQAYEAWQAGRLAKVDQLAKTPEFRELLARAATDPANLGATDDELEEYVARYYSVKKALEFKRSRLVVGGCSMDDSPRRHALSIAQLSAEAVNWETFLRAHLDIMNDRFERVSDGSYAWAGRKTYLRELEELDIDVPDLLLGITLRIDNPSQNHYFGSLGRLGRALAETRQPQELEQRLLAMVADLELDTYNRVLAYYLFLNYNHYLEDQARQQQNVARLNAAVQQLPTYLVARATVPAGK